MRSKIIKLKHAVKYRLSSLKMVSKRYNNTPKKEHHQARLSGYCFDDLAIRTKHQTLRQRPQRNGRNHHFAI